MSPLGEKTAVVVGSQFRSNVFFRWLALNPGRSLLLTALVPIVLSLTLLQLHQQAHFDIMFTGFEETGHFSRKREVGRKGAFRSLALSSSRHASTLTDSVPERSYPSWHITFIYSSSHNLLTTEDLTAIAAFENRVFETREYNDTAMIDPLGTTPISSFNQFLSPTMHDRTIYFNGRNSTTVITDDRIHTSLRYALKSQEPRWFFGDNLNVTSMTCRHMRSEIAVGSPVGGFTNPGDASNVQDNLMRPKVLALRDKFLDIWDAVGDEYPHSISLAWGGDFITEDEIIDVLISDAMWAIPSLVVILLYCLYHLRSVFLSVAAVFLLLLSFPASFAIYLLTGATYIGALNVLSFYIMLGIGVDDIFVFSSTFFFARRPPAPPRVAIAADEFLADNSFRQVSFVDDFDEQHSLVLQLGEDCPYILSWFHGGISQLEKLLRVTVDNDTIKLGTWDIKIKTPEGAQRNEMLQKIAVFCHFAEVPLDGVSQSGSDMQRKLKKEVLERFAAPTATIDRIEQGILHADYTAKGTLDARNHAGDGIALDQRLAYTMRTAGTALFVTSATTAMAFLSNFVSSIPAVRSFGELMSILVVMNYLLTVVVFPAALAFWMVYMRGRTMKEVFLNMWLLLTWRSNKIRYNLIRAAINKGEGIESNPPSTPTLVTGEVAGIEMLPVSPGNVDLVLPSAFETEADVTSFAQYSSPNTQTAFTRSQALMSQSSVNNREYGESELRHSDPNHTDGSQMSESSYYETEVIPGEGLAFKVIGLSGALVRKERELSSDPVGDLPIGEVVIVREIWKNRARLVHPVEGWVSLASELGGSILQRRESSDVLSSYDEHGAGLSSSDDEADEEDTLEDSPFIRQLFDKVLWRYLKRFSNLLLITMLMATLISAYVASTLQIQDHKPYVFPSSSHIHIYKIQDEIFGSSSKCVVTLSTERCTPWYTQSRELRLHTDCAGKLYGTATLDACGVCGGTGNSCIGCDGNLNSNMVWTCGKCVPATEVHYCTPSRWLSLTLDLPCEYGIDQVDADFTDFEIVFLIGLVADVTMVYRDVAAAETPETVKFDIKSISPCVGSAFTVSFQLPESTQLQHMTLDTFVGSFTSLQYFLLQEFMQNITVTPTAVSYGLSDTTSYVIPVPDHSAVNDSNLPQAPPEHRPLETFGPSVVDSMRRGAVLSTGTTILVGFSNYHCSAVAPDHLKASISLDILSYTSEPIHEYNFDCSSTAYSIYLFFLGSLSDNLSSLTFTRLLSDLSVATPSVVEKHPGHVYNNSDVINDWPIAEDRCVNFGEPAVIIDGKKSKTCSTLQSCVNEDCLCNGLLQGDDCSACDVSCTSLGGDCTSQGWCRWCDGRESQSVDRFTELSDPKLRDQCNVCGLANTYHSPNGTDFVGGPANGTCRGCDGVVNSGMQFDSCQVCGGSNACLISSLNLEQAVDVYFVWGIDAESSKGDLTGANQYAAFDPRFSPELPECQLMLVDVCTKYRKHDPMIDQYVIQEGVVCFIQALKEWQEVRGGVFPIPGEQFGEALYTFITYNQANVDLYGPYIGFTVDKGVRYLMLKFKSSEKAVAGPKVLKEHFDWWEADMKYFNDMNVCGSPGYQTSPSWSTMFLELAALRELVSSLVISGLAALVVVVLFTCDIWITVQVMITIVGIVMVTLMTMKLGSYTVGPVEAVAFSAVIGLAVDYTVHFAHGWGQYWMYLIKNGHSDTKPGSVIYRIVLDLGTPLMNAALTTVISTCFLFATTIVPLSEFALVLVVSTSWSIFYSVFLFIPFLLSFPPSQWWRNLRPSIRLITSYTIGGLSCAIIGTTAYFHVQTMA